MVPRKSDRCCHQIATFDNLFLERSKQAMKPHKTTSEATHQWGSTPASRLFVYRFEDTQRFFYSPVDFFFLFFQWFLQPIAFAPFRLSPAVHIFYVVTVTRIRRRMAGFPPPASPHTVISCIRILSLRHIFIVSNRPTSPRYSLHAIDPCLFLSRTYIYMEEYATGYLKYQVYIFREKSGF